MGWCEQMAKELAQDGELEDPEPRCDECKVEEEDPTDLCNKPVGVEEGGEEETQPPPDGGGGAFPPGDDDDDDDDGDVSVQFGGGVGCLEGQLYDNELQICKEMECHPLKDTWSREKCCDPNDPTRYDVEACEGPGGCDPDDPAYDDEVCCDPTSIWYDAERCETELEPPPVVEPPEDENDLDPPVNPIPGLCDPNDEVNYNPDYEWDAVAEECKKADGEDPSEIDPEEPIPGLNDWPPPVVDPVPPGGGGGGGYCAENPEKCPDDEDDEIDPTEPIPGSVDLFVDPHAKYCDPDDPAYDAEEWEIDEDGKCWRVEPTNECDPNSVNYNSDYEWTNGGKDCVKKPEEEPPGEVPGVGPVGPAPGPAFDPGSGPGPVAPVIPGECDPGSVLYDETMEWDPEAKGCRKRKATEEPPTDPPVEPPKEPPTEPPKDTTPTGADGSDPAKGLKPPPCPPEGKKYQDKEKTEQLMQWVNWYRVKNGKQPMTRNQDLVNAASSQSTYMATKAHKLTHYGDASQGEYYPAERVAKEVDWTPGTFSVLEAIAATKAGDQDLTAEDIFLGWMNSGQHDYILLWGNHDEVGISLYGGYACLVSATKNPGPPNTWPRVFDQPDTKTDHLLSYMDGFKSECDPHTEIPSENPGITDSCESKPGPVNSNPDMYLFQLINEYRVSKCLHPLIWNQELYDQAVGTSQLNSDNGRPEHIRAPGTVKYAGSFNMENVSGPNSGSPDRVLAGWLDDEAHRCWVESSKIHDGACAIRGVNPAAYSTFAFGAKDIGVGSNVFVSVTGGTAPTTSSDPDYTC